MYEGLAERIIEEYENIDHLMTTYEVKMFAVAIQRALDSECKIKVKVKRNEDAKQFPLIKISKDGDVGFDLYAVTPYYDQWKCAAKRSMEIIRIKDMSDGMLTTKEIEEQLEREVFRQRIIVRPGDRCEIPTGVFLELPKNHWATINGRSSTSREMLIAPDGVIDEGYRGELFAVLMNVGTEPKTIYHGDRKVQLIIHERKSGNITIEEVEELSQSERGDSGFGSTGK